MPELVTPQGRVPADTSLTPLPVPSYTDGACAVPLVSALVLEAFVTLSLKPTHPPQPSEEPRARRRAQRPWFRDWASPKATASS
jgi:hypothetical protein